MGTQTSPSVRKSTLRPSRQKYKATSSDKQPIRQRHLRTPSSESGVPRSMTVRHARSSISNPASTPAPFRQHSRRAYTIMHSKYHGHRRRRNSDAVKSAVQPQHTLITPFIFQDPTFGQPLQITESSDSSQEGDQRDERLRAQREYPGGIYS